MRALLAATVAVAGALTAAAARAQAPEPTLGGACGTYYVVAFPDTVRTTSDPRYPNTTIRSEASLWIYSSSRNRVRVEHASGEYKTELLLDAGKFKELRLPIATVVETSNTPVRWAFMVEADYPIFLVCYMADNQGLEAWTPLPVSAWGKRYRAAAVPGEVVGELGLPAEVEIPVTLKEAPAEITIVAAYDNTHVTLTPPATAGFAGNPPRSVTLRKGEVYQVQSVVDLAAASAGPGARQQDMAATRIEADRPVGVLSGNTRAQVDREEEGIKNNVYKNLMIEWLRPVEQYGREFVYMPTWDAHRAGIGADAARKREYLRVYPGAAGELKGTISALDSGATAPAERAFAVAADTMAELPIAPYEAAHVVTDAPAQAMMHSTSIVKANGETPCFRGLPCISYSAWAPYMVEVVPREQWGSFAPYYASGNPGTMQHYINVVADTISARKIYRENGSLFIFTRKIPGTDLIWGMMPVIPGETHWLAGRDGATFGGFVYGVRGGSEDYRPGVPARKKEGRSTASGGDADGGPAALHPAEFEEITAVSYGYPLLSMGRVLRAPDSVVIDTIRTCSGLTIRARAVSADPVGFRSAALDPATSVNARLTAIDPTAATEINGRSSIELRVEAIDPRHPASGVVEITDRTGKVWRIPFTTESKFLVFDPGSIMFDSIPAHRPIERMVRIVNTVGTPLTVDRVRLARGDEGYVVVATNPHGPVEQPPSPVVLAPREAMTVTVRALPPAPERSNSYIDSLAISFDCGWETLPLDVERTPASVERIAGAEGRALAVAAHGDRVRISYAIGRPGMARLAIYDGLGRHVETLANLRQDASEHTVEWDASAWASGVYYCVIESSGWRGAAPFVVTR